MGPTPSTVAVCGGGRGSVTRQGAEVPGWTLTRLLLGPGSASDGPLHRWGSESRGGCGCSPPHGAGSWRAWEWPFPVRTKHAHWPAFPVCLCFLIHLFPSVLVDPRKGKALAADPADPTHLPRSPRASQCCLSLSWILLHVPFSSAGGGRGLYSRKGPQRNSQAERERDYFFLIHILRRYIIAWYFIHYVQYIIGVYTQYYIIYTRDLS